MCKAIIRERGAAVSGRICRDKNAGTGARTGNGVAAPGSGKDQRVQSRPGKATLRTDSASFTGSLTRVMSAPAIWAIRCRWIWP